MNDFMKGQVGRYFAVRTYSHTDRRQLWKVITRPIMDFLSATVYADVERQDCPKGQEVFIVRVVDDTDEEVALNRRVNDAWHQGYNECLRRVKEKQQYDFGKI